VSVGASLSYADVALAPDDPALRARREMEVAFGPRMHASAFHREREVAP
jgi:hypothetical protein